jgi:hypothetical protein
MATHTHTHAFDLWKTHRYTPTHEMHYEYMFLYMQPQLIWRHRWKLLTGIWDELKIETGIHAGTDVGSDVAVHLEPAGFPWMIPESSADAPASVLCLTNYLHISNEDTVCYK